MPPFLFRRSLHFEHGICIFLTGLGDVMSNFIDRVKIYVRSGHGGPGGAGGFGDKKRGYMGPRQPGDRGPQARPAEKKLTHNPFVLDEERVKRLTEIARQSQREEMLSAAIRGESLSSGLQMVDMPDSSVDKAVAEVAMPSLGMAATSLPAPMDMPSASDN